MFLGRKCVYIISAATFRFLAVPHGRKVCFFPACRQQQMQIVLKTKSWTDREDTRQIMKNNIGFSFWFGIELAMRLSCVFTRLSF